MGRKVYMPKDGDRSVHGVLNALGKKVNKRWPYLNHGGCCVFASCVGEELALRGIETSVIVAASWGTEEKNINSERAKLNENRLAAWNKSGIYFHHVGVEYIIDHDSFHYDSNGSHHADGKLGDWIVYEGRLSVEDAGDLANNDNGWNDCFDREEIPRLRRFIRMFLHVNLPVGTDYSNAANDAWIALQKLAA